MARSLASSRLIYGAAYFGVVSLIILFQILPIEFGPGGYPGPDLVICITFAWVLRRPHYVPTPLIALIFLITDLLFMRPPGLWTALVVLGVEFLRGRIQGAREGPFLAEWAMVSTVLATMTLADRAILSIFAVGQVGFGPTALQLAATVLAYPLIVGLSRLILGVRKMTPAEADGVARAR